MYCKVHGLGQNVKGTGKKESGGATKPGKERRKAVVGEISGWMKYRGRLAPSPTGYLHVGHARTFWAAYERARRADGTLVMRIDDLDPDRSRPEFTRAAIDDLRWLGIDWDEGPDTGGPLAPYQQSQRAEVYRAAWRRLGEGGFLYPCRCSRKDLAAALSAPHESARPTHDFGVPTDRSWSVRWHDPDDEPVYPGTCRSLHAADSESSALNANWRFRVPDGEAIEFVDLNLGPQRLVAGVDFGDFVVLRRDGVASYQLACVADDIAMKITEVVRGTDMLKSTARQILLYRALGSKAPAWFHCPLVLDAQGNRLAKRHAAQSVRALRERGLTPAQVLLENVPSGGSC